MDRKPIYGPVAFSRPSDHPAVEVGLLFRPEHDLHDALEFEFDLLRQDTFGELPPQRSICLELIQLASTLALGVDMVCVPAGKLFDLALPQAGLASEFMRLGSSPPSFSSVQPSASP